MNWKRKAQKDERNGDSARGDNENRAIAYDTVAKRCREGWKADDVTKAKDGQALTSGTPRRTYGHEPFQLEGVAEDDVDDTAGPVVAHVPGLGDVAGRADVEDVACRDESAGGGC